MKNLESETMMSFSSDFRQNHFFFNLQREMNLESEMSKKIRTFLRSSVLIGWYLLQSGAEMRRHDFRQLLMRLSATRRLNTIQPYVLLQSLQFQFSHVYMK